jgi:hypothetical protein
MEDSGGDGKMEGVMEETAASDLPAKSSCRRV